MISAVPDREGGVGVRRAHDSQARAIGGAVGAEEVGSVNLCAAVEPRDAGADGSGFRDNFEVFAARDRHHRLHDRRVAGTATEYAAERGFHRGRGRARIAHQAIGGRHQHGGRTNAALGGTIGEEGLAQPIREPGRTRPFHRLHLGTGDLTARYEAGADLTAVEDHRAGAAVTGVAADLGSGEAE